MLSAYLAKLNPEEREKIINFFKLLKQKNINSVILRGLIVLENSNSDLFDTDIDILVENKRVSDTLKIMFRLGFTEVREKNNRIDIIAKRISKGLAHPHKIFTWLKNNKITGVFNESAGKMDVHYHTFRYKRINIDVWEHLGHRSLMTNKFRRIDKDIENEIIAEKIIKDSIFPVPSPPHLLAHIINRIILDKEREIPDYYIDTIEGLLIELKNNAQYLQDFDSILRRVYYKAGGLIMNKVLNKEIVSLRTSVLNFTEY